ncbi:NAD-dependent epimerase/dehydratase family protein [Sphingobium sp. H39-3-25]|uniref:D-erythronate dehydrogenase n=1 Tax=Sphingobium arseniciresistens TaxID=3030834 RepID=UPI0023B91319|nr:NAD-dependent epimerase/dehydratase family protein [Sphingobium arseniciresistens]
MNIVITGGGGFLGLRLARALLQHPPAGVQVDRIVLADRVEAPDLGDPRVVSAVGDIADDVFLATILTKDVQLVYHLAAIVSGEAEANFDLGLKINIDASRLLLDKCRQLGTRPRVVFTSSIAVFGPQEPDAVISDGTSVDPRSSYGMEKAAAELLLKEYSRREMVDGIVLRLPTISVRPGRPNKAASSFASGIIREPLCGIAAPCPVPSSTSLWLLSPRRAVEALMVAATLDTASLGMNRTINLPGISVTVGEMLAALQDAGGADVRALVTDEPDAAVEHIVASWPRAWDDSRARTLGFSGDADFRSIIDAFITDDLAAQRLLFA